MFYSDYNVDGSVWKYGDNRTFYLSIYSRNNFPNGKLPVNRPGQMDCLNIYTGKLFEPRSEKTGLRGFRQGPTQIRLYSHRRWLEA